jgi:predicted TIM-barrel fold metal-dependent hydrolase
VDGEPILDGKVATVAALMSDRTDEPKRWEDVPVAAYRPADRLKAMDADGVEVSVLYPTVAGHAGETFGRITDPELELACVQAYNDWLIEEWASASDRFVPQCIVPLWPAEAAVAEIQRAAAKGHKGVIYPGVPMHLRDVPHVNGTEYDPIWSACEELNVPLCLHAGASTRLQYAPVEGLAPAVHDALAAVTRPISSVYVITHFTFSKALIRHPRMRVVLGESALSWGMLYMEWADHQYEHDGLPREGYDMKPSEMFKRQCYLTSWFDNVAAFAPFYGIDRVLWATNYPLATSTWPRTRQAIAHCFEGVSPEDREAALWNNAAELYGIK